MKRGPRGEYGCLSEHQKSNFNEVFFLCTDITPLGIWSNSVIYGALLHWKPITHLQNQISQRTNGTNETKTKISLIILLYIHAIVNFL